MVVRLLVPSPPLPAPPAAALREAPAVPAEAVAVGREAPKTGPARASPAATPSPDASVSPANAAPSRYAPPESEYLAAARLDPGPKLLDDVEPVYPAGAGLTEGSVVLRLLIGRTGTVDEISVVRAQPKGLFDRAAVAAFAAARFSPGMLLGVPVKSQVTIEVQFTPVDRGANVSAPTY